MELIQQDPELSAYLAADEVVDHGHPVVRETAAALRARHPDVYAYARAAYVYVRDQIPHSSDTGDPRVTWRASDVLAQGTGICHAKAHALAALLRAESIPTALCYQKFEVLHGLVAIRLPGMDSWHRQDPRGGVPGQEAEFSLEGERLAFLPDPEFNEVDYPVLYSVPHAGVLSAMRAAPDSPELLRILPTDL
ncbi:transglutaminase [Streptomyces sp. Je 1-79]|uniref:transglutaminase domain-containing protein n=1 Tax=Streptomyces sp. Je 1-79 TaxID=2943847 RepID=UPI0021A94EE1|nr:transglutaminase domain-containing protein [Streptomyces sp. Je 1-79]MCT4353836.1 transglutaminase [Streptomyces sp. Je 1-79]